MSLSGPVAEIANFSSTTFPANLDPTTIVNAALSQHGLPPIQQNLPQTQQTLPASTKESLPPIDDLFLKKHKIVGIKAA